MHNDWLHTLKGIRDLRMRAVLMAEHLREDPPESTIQLLSTLITRAVRRGDDHAVVALSTLTSALGDAALISYDVRRQLYTAAKRLGHEEVARLFIDVSPMQSMHSDRSDTSADPLACERPVEPHGRTLTLGERKTLARCHRRDLLQHLLRDPHPDVVTVLLENPHLTERDVVTLAARRPTTPGAQTAVAASARWCARYQVKRALVKNPYTPVPLAMRLATTLRASDLRAVARDAQLAEPLRAQALTLVSVNQGPARPTAE